MTPTEKDAMALATLAECADDIARDDREPHNLEHRKARGERILAEYNDARAHLASRVAELESERNEYRADAEIANARATRAEAELAAVRSLLIEIRGDCDVAYGVSEQSYRQFCGSGAMGRMPSDTWARHCQRRIDQIDAAVDAARGGGDV